jgi:hypothetical protein
MRWSEADCLSRIVLSHTPRQATASRTLDVRQKHTMTLRISAFMALVATSTAAYAAIWMSRLYSELLKGSPLPPLTEAVIWRGGIVYWLLVPITVLALYFAGERRLGEPQGQRFAESHDIEWGIVFALHAWADFTTHPHYGHPRPIIKQYEMKTEPSTKLQNGY